MATIPTLADLYTYGAPSAAFGSLTDGDRTKAIQSAYDELEAAAASQGKLPLGDPLPGDIVQKICHVAAYELIARVGFNPAAGSDQNYLIRCNTARAYFRDIAKSVVHPRLVFATAPNDRAQPQVRSKPLRGW